MKKKNSINTTISLLKKIRAGETYASQCYEVNKDAIFYDDKTTLSPCTKNFPSQSQFVVDDISDDSYLSDQHVEDFHSLQQHKVKRPSPFEDSIKCNKLDNFIIHHSEQNRRQTMTQMEMAAMESLNNALEEEEEEEVNATVSTLTLHTSFTTDIEPSLNTDCKASCTLSHKNSFSQNLVKDFNTIPNYENAYSKDIIKKALISQDSLTEKCTNEKMVISENITDKRKNNLTKDIEINECLPSMKKAKTDNTFVNEISHSDLPILKNNLTHAISIKDNESYVKNPLTQEICVSHSLESIKNDLLKRNQILFYLLDIYEEKHRLFLYGTSLNLITNESQSCCVIIQEIMRNIFIHPKEQPELTQDILANEACKDRISQTVNEELSIVRKQLGINRCMFRAVQRHVVFQTSLLKKKKNTLFIKYVYSSKFPPFPSTLTGKTFDHCLGSKTSLTELFLLKRHIFGPTWLTIQEPKCIKSCQITFCKEEFIIDNMDKVSLLKDNLENEEFHAPRTLIFCFTVQPCVLSSEKYESQPSIAAITACWYTINDLDAPIDLNRVPLSHFCGITLPNNLTMWPLDYQKYAEQHNIQLFDNEHKLLTYFFNLIHTIDPDILISHGLVGSICELLAQRATTLSLHNWDMMSRYRRHVNDLKHVMNRSLKNSIAIASFLTIGRLLCDVELQAREILRHERTYDLPSLLKHFYPQAISPHLLLPIDVPNAWKFKDKTFQMVLNCKEITFFTLDVSFQLKILSLTRELTCLAGNLWNRSLLNFRSERNEMFLLHEFHKRKLMKPEPFHLFTQKLSDDFIENTNETQNTSLSKVKDTYTGGLVLEPRTGLYDSFILLLDFNSLYPSIIQEFNICFTTIEEENITECKPGLLPLVLKQLVQKRKAVKNAMKSCSNITRHQLDLKQQALKLIANSIYGCLGFSHSRFYAKPLASLITQKGRELLQKTRDRVENDLRLNVIYGDTDSLMIDSGIQDDGDPSSYAKALKIGSSIEKLINTSQSNLEIELESVFSRLLLLRKKKYACIKVIDYTQKKFQYEYKGLDIVRRDWCFLTRELGEEILRIIFDSQNTVETVVEKIHTLLEKTCQALTSGSIPVEKFLITKGISKMPHHYPDAKNQPHVQVAKRLIEKGYPIHVGSEIQYVILKTNEPNTPAINRAYAIQEMKQLDYPIDIEWYKTTQILPPIARLCEHLQETDYYRLAKCLGIHVRESKTNHLLSDTLQDKHYYDNTVHVSLPVLLDQYKKSHYMDILENEKRQCPFCQQLLPMSYLLKHSHCFSCHQQYPLQFLLNWLTYLTHSLFMKYGRFERLCQDCHAPATCRIFINAPYMCPQVSCSEFKNDLTLAPTLSGVTIRETLEYIISSLLELWKSDNDAYEKIKSASVTSRKILTEGLNINFFNKLFNVCHKKT